MESVQGNHCFLSLGQKHKIISTGARRRSRGCTFVRWWPSLYISSFSSPSEFPPNIQCLSFVLKKIHKCCNSFAIKYFVVFAFFASGSLSDFELDIWESDSDESSSSSSPLNMSPMESDNNFLLHASCCNARLMYCIIEVIVWVFIVYSQYIRCCRVPEGYVASRLTMSNKVYMLQMKIQSCYLKLLQHKSPFSSSGM